MKKFTKIVSLVLALVLAIGASAIPAFAANDDCKRCKSIAETGDLSLNYNWNYKSDGVGHDIVITASWQHSCFKGPIIFGIEEKRDVCLKYLQKGDCTAVYYMDEVRHLYTDMPKYGGVLLARYGTPEWNELMYGPYVNPNDTSGKLIPKKTTMWDNMLTIYLKSKAAAADTTPFGFADIKDTDWYAPAVNALANAGILKGVGNNHFDPNATITWEQMYWILERLLGINDEYLPTSTNNLTIHEIVGAIMGWSDGALPANDKTPVNRAEAVSIIAALYSIRADRYDNEGYLYKKDTGDGRGVWANSAIAGLARKAVANGATEWTLDMIPDHEALGELYYSWEDDFNIKTCFSGYNADGYNSIYATVATGTNVIDIPNILRAYTLGLVKGYDSKGTLGPTDTLTRAQFCQLLYNAGVFGCIYPTLEGHECAGNGSIGNLNVDVLANYLETHATDGTPVNKDGTVKN